MIALGMGAIVPELRSSPWHMMAAVGSPQSLELAPQGENSWWVSTQTRPHPHATSSALRLPQEESVSMLTLCNISIYILLFFLVFQIHYLEWCYFRFRK